MLIGVIADDFTGASDIANTLAKGVQPEGGLRTAQYPGVPTDPADASIEAGVVSLKSRSAPVQEAVRDSLDALAWLRAQGCKQIIFKYCSTFDSTPAGNIGPVADALAEALETTGVVVCPAFPTTGRTVYQGHLFVGDTLLSESGMQHHPLTPMTDPDLRRFLGLQTTAGVGHIPLSIVSQGVQPTRDAINGATDRYVVADAVSDADLLTLGAALTDAKLITGGSGIALGLPRNLIAGRKPDARVADAVHVSGPEAILAGSCSGATRNQVDLHAQAHPTLAIDVPGVMEGRVTVETLVAFYDSNQGRAPLAYSSGSPDQVLALQSRYGREAVAEKLDNLFADTAKALVSKGYRRIVAAGGETSGAVAQAVTEVLGAAAMTVGAEIDPGVPILTLGDGPSVALALKSGNFGAPDFFAKALQMMEGRS
ncbi:3-oxo-tetronate kinase [Sulfitobacter pontiacus]|uniref:3-oxo-tetronate kinase n=1 Tax=Sulfitobacter pontiacus TaxID=60137 RepID=UPI00044A1083|nr:3-oxo-tetronate kinase [Sulfitobacter pontiacus]KAJ29433.1 HPr kinase [Sulfitobacter pontiacus 3SOLIMAR09]